MDEHFNGGTNKETSGFVILTGQTFEAEPAPEHSELIILTSYAVFRTLLPAGRAPLQGQRIPLLRVFVAFGGLESVRKALWMMFGITHRTIFAVCVSEQWGGNEFTELKLVAFSLFFSPSEEKSPRIQIWAVFQELVGGWLYATNMIFYPFDRMYIYAAIFQTFCQGRLKSPHLDLTFKSSHVGDLNQE